MGQIREVRHNIQGNHFTDRYPTNAPRLTVRAEYLEPCVRMQNKLANHPETGRRSNLLLDRRARKVAANSFDFRLR